MLPASSHCFGRSDAADSWRESQPLDESRLSFFIHVRFVDCPHLWAPFVFGVHIWGSGKMFYQHMWMLEDGTCGDTTVQPLNLVESPPATTWRTQSTAKVLRSRAVGEISLLETSHKSPPARSSDGAGAVLLLCSSEMLAWARRSCRTRETFAYNAWCLAVWCPAYRKRKRPAIFDQYKERKKMALLDTEELRGGNISGLRLDMEDGKNVNILGLRIDMEEGKDRTFQNWGILKNLCSYEDTSIF